MIDTNKYHIAIISHLRPKNVPKVSMVLGNVHWYVGEGEAQSYKNQGAEFVIESGGLCRSRNHAIDDAQAAGKICVEFSDDFSSFKEAYILDKTGQKKARPIGVATAIDRVYDSMVEVGAKYGGVAPTANPFFFHEDKPISTKNFIVGDFILIDKDTPLRFDENMFLKEDYDYTLQHLKEYGVVARDNSILATFAHRTNKGGAVAFRTSEREQEAISYLKNKWPENIRDNARRPDEILMKWKG